MKKRKMSQDKKLWNKIFKPDCFGNIGNARECSDLKKFQSCKWHDECFSAMLEEIRKFVKEQVKKYEEVSKW